MALRDVKQRSRCKYLSALAFITLLLAVRTTKVSGWKYLHFVKKPNRLIHTDIGKNVSMNWLFTVDEHRPYKEEEWPFEFLFGEWKYPGYISLKMMLVKGSHISLKNGYYHDKIIWNGNMSNPSNCSGQVTLVNLTSKDFKTYGINIFAHPYIMPLQQALRIVRRKPAKIISWLSVKVYEGNSTVIKCEAEGAPLPFVQIHKKNEPNTQLANGTGGAVYDIVDVRPKDQGEYICTVHSEDEPRSPFTKSMQLSVQKRATGDGLANTKPRGTPKVTSNKGSKAVEQPIKAAYIMTAFYVISSIYRS